MIEFEKERDGEREAGVYVAEFTGVETFEFTDKTTNETESRWRWMFRDVDGHDLDTLTSPHFRPRSNGLKLFTGLLEREPRNGDKPADLAGKIVNVVWGPNQGGKLTIVGVAPYKPLAVKK